MSTGEGKGSIDTAIVPVPDTKPVPALKPPGPVPAAKPSAATASGTVPAEGAGPAPGEGATPVKGPAVVSIEPLEVELVEEEAPTSGASSGGKTAKPLVIAIAFIIIAAAVGAGAYMFLAGSGDDPDESPRAVIAGPVSGVVYPAGKEVVLNGTGSRDPDGGELVCMWSSSIDGYLGVGLVTTATLTSGLHSVTLRVIDDEGDQDEASVVMDVKDPPVAVISSPLPDTAYYTTQELYLDGGNSTSPSGYGLSWMWNSSIDGTVGTYPALMAALSEGVHDLTLAVDDGVLTGVANITVDVRANSGPSAVIARPLSGITYYTTEAVLFSANSSSDPDGHELSYNWTSDTDGVLGTEPSFELNLSKGTHEITLLVDDGFGGTDTDEVTIVVEVGNLPPVADAGVDLRVEAGDLVVLNGSDSHDPEGKDLEYSWDPGDGSQALEGLEVTHIFGEAGTYEVTLEVSDGEKTASDSISAEVQEPGGEGAVIYGYVYDNETGEPIERAEVEIYGDSWWYDDDWGDNGSDGVSSGGSGGGSDSASGGKRSGGSRGDDWNYATTDEYGYYRMKVEPGEWWDIWVQAGGYQDHWDYEEFEVKEGDVLQYDFRLDPLPPENSAIYGTVYDNVTNEPLEYVYLDFSNYDYYAWKSAESDEDGDYRVDVSAGEWEVYAWEDGYLWYHSRITVGENEDVRHDVYLDPEPAQTSRLYGWVNDSDTDTFLNGAEIDVQDEQYTYYNWTESKAGGAYEMWLPEGTYTVNCYYDGSGKDYSSFYAVVEVGAEEEFLFNISLHAFMRTEVNMTLEFDGWNAVSLSSEAVMYEDTQWLRYSLDTNGDGTVSTAEVTAFEALMGPMAQMNTTKDILFVDGTYFDVVPGSTDVDIRDAEGPTSSTEPITILTTAQYQSHTNIPPALTHDVEVNVTYNDNYTAFTFYVILPAGYSLSSADHSQYVEVTGAGEVLIVPADDPDDDDEVYGEWVAIEAS